jgi:hypothetical protein
VIRLGEDHAIPLCLHASASTDRETNARRYDADRRVASSRDVASMPEETVSANEDELAGEGLEAGLHANPVDTRSGGLSFVGGAVP